MSDDDYGFEYSDDDQEEEDVNIENQYYNSKGLLDEDMDAALEVRRAPVQCPCRVHQHAACCSR